MTAVTATATATTATAATAAHQRRASSRFATGWRPFMGWVCGAGFALQYVLGPLLEWAAAVAGHPVGFPQADMAAMAPLLGALLGLGAYRTAEKIKGVAQP